MSAGVPPNIAELTGPLFLGHIFNWALFGVLGVQSYIYYLSFPNDRLAPKLIVSVIVIVETLQSVLSIRDAFRNFGTGWGDPGDLNTIGWLWFSVPVLDAIISSIAQLFYAWRIWMLSKQIYIPVIVSLISVTQLVAGVWTGIWSSQIGVFSNISHTFKTTSVWLGGTALCDVIIAASMIFYLSTSRNGFRATNLLITKILRVTVETGLLCATFAILDLTFFLAYRHNNYHLTPSIALSKLYSNSLLALFNARVRIVGGRGMDTITDSGSGDSELNFGSSLSRRGDGAITVSVVNADATELNEHQKKYSVHP